MDRKYLLEEERAVKDAKDAYRAALVLLQKNCPHDVILKHEDSSYTVWRVCENCGKTSITDWDSPVRTKGDISLREHRAYSVGWSTFASTTPMHTPKGSGPWGT